MENPLERIPATYEILGSDVLLYSVLHRKEAY